jgi:hypothetical protein
MDKLVLPRLTESFDGLLFVEPTAWKAFRAAAAFKRSLDELVSAFERWTLSD